MHSLSSIREFGRNLTVPQDQEGHNCPRVEDKDCSQGVFEPPTFGLSNARQVQCLLGQLNFGAGGWEHATVRFLPTGLVEVVTGTSPHGQGHETSWSMIAADCLGVPPDDATPHMPLIGSRRLRWSSML